MRITEARKIATLEDIILRDIEKLKTMSEIQGIEEIDILLVLRIKRNLIKFKHLNMNAEGKK